MGPSTIQMLRSRLIQSGMAGEDTVRGCSPAEVAEVAARQGVALPERYVEFLLVMGRGAGAFFRGSDVFYPTVLELKGRAQDLLEECGRPFILPGDAVVFFMHQGYQFMYCRTRDGAPDPFVYYYEEQQAAPIRHEVTFTELLEGEFLDQRRLLARSPPGRTDGARGR